VNRSDSWIFKTLWIVEFWRWICILSEIWISLVRYVIELIQMSGIVLCSLIIKHVAFSTEGPLDNFSWRVNGHFCLCEAWMRIDFFTCFPNLYSSVLGKLVFQFHVIREICINSRVICEPTIFAGINFKFFGDFSVTKARSPHQTTRCKTCQFDALELERKNKWQACTDSTYENDFPSV